jgi:hypothetical protein
MKRACFPVIPGRALARTRNPERQAVRLHLDSVFATGAGPGMTAGKDAPHDPR